MSTPSVSTCLNGFVKLYGKVRVRSSQDSVAGYKRLERNYWRECSPSSVLKSVSKLVLLKANLEVSRQPDTYQLQVSRQPLCIAYRCLVLQIAFMVVDR